MNPERRTRFGLHWWALLGMLLAWGMWLTPVQAHGGGTPQVVAVPVGPYALSVWSQPDPPRVGTLHLTAAVFRPGGAADEPVTDARVTAYLTASHGETLEVPLTHAQAANPLYYEADVRLPAAGRWTVTVVVDGPNGGGEVAFDLEVARALPLGGWGLGVVAVVALVVVYFFAGGKRS